MDMISGLLAKVPDETVQQIMVYGILSCLVKIFIPQIILC